jgi:4-amino-4-deoxy-L-arabinose transferase-like glycosyltransferase
MQSPFLPDGNHRMPFSGALYKYRFHLLFLAIFSVYFLNLFIDIMDVDAAQYALISMEMSVSKSFLHVYQLGHDYLDKPPLLFWLSSFSFLLFGVSNWAYKLPSVLAALLGIYSVYRFSKIYYSREKSVLAALILASSQALFLITNDVRTDTLLMAFVVFAVWQLSAYLNSGKWKNLLLGAVGVGAAMLAKGPVGMVIPAVALGGDLLIKRQWKAIFKPQWLILLLVVAVLLAPMAYGLYTQFDLHPEKTVYGLHGPSGLKFFFWTQSFGRITGASSWDNHTGFFYFFHTILWDFEPWIWLFIPAVVLKLGKLFRQKLKSNGHEEYVSLSGFVLMFLAFSLSRYKLPHYIFVLFPFAAVITADFIYDLKGHLQKKAAAVQFGVLHAFWLLMVLDFLFIFPPNHWVLPVLLVLLFVMNELLFKKIKNGAERIFIPTIVTAVAFNLLMAVNFYPHLLQYQAGSQIGKYVSENHIPANRFYACEPTSFSLHFYARRTVPSVQPDAIKSMAKGTWIVADEKNYHEIQKEGVRFKLLKVFPSYPVTRLKLSFLNKKTRDKTLDRKYLLELE